MTGVLREELAEVGVLDLLGEQVGLVQEQNDGAIAEERRVRYLRIDFKKGGGLEEKEGGEGRKTRKE